MPDVRARLATLWQDSAAARAAVRSLWQEAAPVRSRGSAYTPPPAPPGAVTITPGSLSPTTRILPAVDYPLATAWRVVDLRTDDELPVTSFEFGIEDKSAAWSCTLQGKRPLLLALEAGEQPAQVRIEIGGQAWAFVVDSTDAPQAFASQSVSAQGRSLVALADAPHTLSTQWTVAAPTTAAQLASAAQTFCGLAIAWEIDSWLIPPGAWSGSGTPLDLLRQVAGSVQAVIEPEAAGFGVKVRSRYPVMPNLWHYTPPDVQVDWMAVFSHSRVQADQPPYTAMYLAGQQQGAVAQVRLNGTSGAAHAPMVTDPLLTDLPALVERARSVLAASGKAHLVQRTLPVLTGADEPGVLQRGQLVRWVDPDETWVGMARAVKVTGTFGRVRQTVTCERRLSFPAGTFVPVPVVPTDPLWEHVVLLLEFEGGAATDLSSASRTVSTIRGAPTYSTAQAKVGTTSMLGGSHPVGLIVDLGAIPESSSLCLEFWYYRTSSDNYHAFGGDDSGNRKIALRTPNNLGAYQFGLLGFSLAEPASVFTAETIPLNTWVHLCASIEKTGGSAFGTLRLFIDGQKKREVSDVLFTPGGNWDIGRSDSSGFSGIGGHIDSYRLTVGHHRYSTDFTPNTNPHPTS